MTPLGEHGAEATRDTRLRKYRSPSGQAALQAAAATGRRLGNFPIRSRSGTIAPRRRLRVFLRGSATLGWTGEDTVRLGIDFGTTRTVVASCDRGNYPVLGFVDHHGDPQDYFPSVVAARGDELQFGFDALAVASRLRRGPSGGRSSA